MLRARPRYPLLDVHASQRGQGTCLVECEGEVDIESAPRFREALDEGLRIGTRQLILDLSRVSFIDSVGVGQIVGAYKRLPEGARLRICTNNEHTRMLLQIAGLSGVSSIHTSVDEAIRAG